MTEETKRNIEEKIREEYREKKQELACWRGKEKSMSRVLDRTSEALRGEMHVDEYLSKTFHEYPSQEEIEKVFGGIRNCQNILGSILQSLDDMGLKPTP